MLRESLSPLRLITVCILILTGLVPPENADGEKTAAGGDEQTTLVAPSWRHTLGLNRVRQTHLDIYSGYRKRFDQPLGIAATKHLFNDKPGTGDDDELTVYGVNSGTGEIIFNTSQMSLGFFSGWPGEKAGFDRPVDVVADREGWVAVSDAGRNHVVYLRNEDNQLHFVRCLDLAETGRPLSSPSGLALEGGRLYIADTGNNRIVVTNLAGEFLGSFSRSGETGPLIQPYDVAVIEPDTWNYYGSSFIVVTDSLHQRLNQLSLDGRPLAALRHSEIAGDPGGFYFTAVDYYSNVYVTDSRTGCVYKFNRFLAYLTRFGCGGGRESDLDEPRGIAIYRRFGQVFIAERAGASYYWVGTDILSPSAEARVGAGGADLQIRFTLTEQSLLTTILETAASEPVDTLAENLFTPPGNVIKTYHLPGWADEGSIANRKYFVTITATATYSSRRYFSAHRKVPLVVR
jgi:hypothetical protein